jgi:arsenate reductase (thioredoxin)
MKILILCTGNSCRSQMAEGFLRFFAPEAEVFSAGTAPSQMVHPKAIQVMKEENMDISQHSPNSVDVFLNHEFDFVITVCGGAQESCPMFTGKVHKKLHIGFIDPAEATGTEDEILTVFRNVRDQIKNDFFVFYKEYIAKS